MLFRLLLMLFLLKLLLLLMLMSPLPFQLQLPQLFQAAPQATAPPKARAAPAT